MHSFIFVILTTLQAPDTTAVKEAIIEADRSLSTAVAARGAQAFLDALAPNAAVLFPGQPTLKGASEADGRWLYIFDLGTSRPHD
jgi:ketosteroid isomerase-like protein